MSLTNKLPNSISFNKTGVNDGPLEKRNQPHLKPSPKEEWQKKVKIIHFKWVLILVLSHLMIHLISAPVEEVTINVPEDHIEAGHQIVHLPAINFASPPKANQKIRVSLVQDDHSRQVEGYLRQVIDDPLAETGQKIIVEIQQADLIHLKGNSNPWLVYPPLGDKHSKKVINKRSVHEVVF